MTNAKRIIGKLPAERVAKRATVIQLDRKAVNVIHTMDSVGVKTVLVADNVTNVKQTSGVIQMLNVAHANVTHMDQPRNNVTAQRDNVNVFLESVDTNVMNVRVVSWEKHHIVNHAVNVLIIGIQH